MSDKNFELEPNSGICVIEQDYLSYKEPWYFITYPAYGFCDIKRIFPNTRKVGYDIGTFHIAYCVRWVTSFWPIDCFNSFMKRVRDAKLDINLVFSGPQPPLNEYLLDEIISEAHTLKKTIKMIKAQIPTIPIRFNPLAFCGSDSQSFPADTSFPHNARLAKYLEPPKKIKDMQAERKLRDAIEQLGVKNVKNWFLTFNLNCDIVAEIKEDKI